MTDPYRERHMELVARHEILRVKASDGEYDPTEWWALIYDMNAHAMFAKANDLKREMTQIEERIE
jgi:hypothetical protein